MQHGRFTPLRQSIIVTAAWDDAAHVWVAESDDIGLATEAPTFDALRERVLAMIPELLELNGFVSDLPEIPVHIHAEQTALVSNTASP